MVGYVHPDGHDDAFHEAYMKVEAEKRAGRMAAENRKGWLFRDPLRGFSIDRWPYSRSEGEIKLDFMFKSCLYVPCVTVGLVEFPFLVLCLSFWLVVNFFRRNG